MYVIVHKNRIILGILPWNNKYYMDVLRVRHDITVELPYTEPEASQFPYVIDADTYIQKAEESRSFEINPMIEQYYGPTWEFLEDKIVGHYEIRPLSIEDAQANYRSKAADLRYKKEIEGTSIVIGGIEHKIETTRESRVKYVEKLVMMEDGSSVNWKFVEGWRTITKSELSSIVSAINTHIQSAFDEELRLVEIINSSTASSELTSIPELNTSNN